MWDLYRSLWRVSARQQIGLVILALAVAGLSAVPLSYQKDIVNALAGPSIDRARLIRLCAEMGGVILLSLFLKWVLGMRASLLGEDMIRRLRQRILADATGPRPDRPALGAGTLTTALSAEAEDLGKFVGSAISEPVVQVGTLAAVIGYIAVKEPAFGLIALAILAPQVALVLYTQVQVNRLVAERLMTLRAATDQVTGTQMDADAAAEQFDAIFATRRAMFGWKLTTKFAMSALAGAGTVGLLFYGGLLVLDGRSDVGTVVAAILGIGRVQAPTSFLISFYRQVAATTVKLQMMRGIVSLEPDPAASARA